MKVGAQAGGVEPAHLLGEERMLTGPEAGITRDAISSDFEWHGEKIKLWDTAGIRRKYCAGTGVNGALLTRSTRLPPSGPIPASMGLPSPGLAMCGPSVR